MSKSSALQEVQYLAMKMTNSEPVSSFGTKV
jgi:hypothetical protein